MPDVAESLSNIKIEGQGFPVSEEERFTVPLSESDARIFFDRVTNKLREILDGWDDGFKLLGIRLLLKNVMDRERNPYSDKVFALIFVTRCPVSIPRDLAIRGANSTTHQQLDEISHFLKEHFKKNWPEGATTVLLD